MRLRDGHGRDRLPPPQRRPRSTIDIVDGDGTSSGSSIEAGVPGRDGSTSSGTAATTRARSSPRASTGHVSSSRASTARSCCRTRSGSTRPRRASTMTRLAPRVFSPDGDRRADRVVVGYRVDEPARVSLYVDGVRAVLKKGRKKEGTIDWFGHVDGEPLPQGAYRLRLGADRRRRATSGGRHAPKTVVIRYVALGRRRIEATPGSRFAVLVLSDAARIDVEARCSHRRGEAGHAPAAGAVAAGALHAHRDGERPQRSCRRVRPEPGAVSCAAEVGSVLGCAGLAVLFVATRRRAPDRRARRLGARPRRARRLSRARPEPAEARRCRRRRVSSSRPPAAGRCCAGPYLLAFATLACLPVRIPVQARRRGCEPAAAAVRRRRLARGRTRLAARRAAGRACPRARAGRAPARGLRRLDRPDARLERRSARGSDLRRRLRAAVRPARARLRAAAVARPLADLALGRARRHGARATPRSASTSGRRATSSGTRR